MTSALYPYVQILASGMSSARNSCGQNGFRGSFDRAVLRTEAAEEATGAASDRPHANRALVGLGFSLFPAGGSPASDPRPHVFLG